VATARKVSDGFFVLVENIQKLSHTSLCKMHANYSYDHGTKLTIISEEKYNQVNDSTIRLFLPIVIFVLTPYYDSIQPLSISPAGLDHALSLGWYRMHQGIFTCSHVNLGDVYRVHWLRYRLIDIKERESHKRILNKNKSFHYSIEDFNPLFIRPDHVELHLRYRASIDFDGARSIHECLLGDDFDGTNIFETKCISVFHGNKLIAGGYFDVGLQAGTSILHFFEPDYKKYSLGKYLILVTMNYLTKHGYRMYYPGYIVQGLNKMNYKLFLGIDAAQFFDPESQQWLYVKELPYQPNSTA
jgi:leucyl-tRNA---protein transferase